MEFLILHSNDARPRDKLVTLYAENNIFKAREVFSNAWSNTVNDVDKVEPKQASPRGLEALR